MLSVDRELTWMPLFGLSGCLTVMGPIVHSRFGMASRIVPRFLLAILDEEPMALKTSASYIVALQTLDAQVSNMATLSVLGHPRALATHIGTDGSHTHVP